MTKWSLNQILADMEQAMLSDDSEIYTELQDMDDGDLIAEWLRSGAQTLTTRRQQLAYAEIGRRGLAG